LTASDIARGHKIFFVFGVLVVIEDQKLRRHVTYKLIQVSTCSNLFYSEFAEKSKGGRHPRFLNPSNISKHITFSATGTGRTRFFVPKYFLQKKGDRKKMKKEKKNKNYQQK